MKMHRRNYLSSMAMAGLTAVSGCLGDDGGDDFDDSSDSETDDTMDSENEDTSGDDGSDDNGMDPSPPQVALEFDANPEANTLTITHTGGETFTAGQVFVTGDGLDQEGYWHEFSGDHGPDDGVAAGFSIQVTVADEFDVEVRWETADGSDSTVIATHSS